MFSLELSENVFGVEQHAFGYCRSLRNIALTFNTVHYSAFYQCYDLLHIFHTEEAIVNAVKSRFYELPLHAMMYYISYYNTPTIREEILHGFVINENGLRNPTGLRQDCLGMTPLHILACSTACLELYQLMVEYYPENLIVEDSWGAIPLLYAVWGDAPREIVQFLVRSYQSIYPSHEFNWTSMITTLGRANALVSAIEHLLDIKQTLSPENAVLIGIRFLVCWLNVVTMEISANLWRLLRHFAFSPDAAL